MAARAAWFHRYRRRVIDHDVAVTFDHDQALVLSDWLDRHIGTARFDALIDEDPAVWAPIHRVGLVNRVRWP
jgi:hypothetical protein